jgi:hypothetical protein
MRMVASMGAQHRSPASRREDERTEAQSHSQIQLMLKSVSAANRCVESLNESAVDRRSSEVASNQHHSSPSRSHTSPVGARHEDTRRLRLPTEPTGRPAAAASPGLACRPGAGLAPHRQAIPPQQAASKLVKFYGETVRHLTSSGQPLMHAARGLHSFLDSFGRYRSAQINATPRIL